ncbi:ScbR family autoregulator-binding transcription factor [Streptomyces sp. MST-110588]|uniref:ScbR family autoregulator-binding transcription factor n=1 Tax=Streptomyces sp. MST-110588 TaxID=2833628 RepID=UPI001F5DCDAB|nr:ScbR family autoregulator-binding transcription factor [Streptomyces sp. MST-110588]UNO43549.1 TetR/AcrR family transcriptional regulator [Streptomyces sp. MST-110588]
MQERAVKTRERILYAASELFDECGFSAASISKIMKRARVTRGAMFFHFPSKEALAHAVMIEQGNGLELPSGEDGLQRLVDITLYLAGELQTNPLLRAGVRLAIEQGVFGARDDSPYRYWAEEFAGQLRAARKKGELLPEVDVEELAWMLVGSYSGTQLLSQISVGRADLHQRVTVLWRYLLPGIAVPAVLPLVTFSGQWDRAAA